MKVTHLQWRTKKLRILDELVPVFRWVFNDSTLIIKPETTANDVDGWDSLSHINLMIAIENRFNIQFTEKEISTFKNINELVVCIEEKTKGIV